MSKVIRVRYENGVLKPLEPLEFEEGKELVIRIIDVEERRRVLRKYKGILGPVDSRLHEEALEEAEHL
ncbi:antitoxin family protein [Hyperthermus butylicus]|uniref:Antitoxin n=1 Tax=Hyperthermus butylicus (strain DSM 5456 / JCM 9403 / PLM1-5) TaxID=415426 RepID=A2BKL6_HYPBU|nr:antitoxin family protein [Hyperthermus butylicus]ABM80527.1 hypothetical protein Hbut_0671 [Hyperthermus butylicus DSM 5456]